MFVGVLSISGPRLYASVSPFARCHVDGFISRACMLALTYPTYLRPRGQLLVDRRRARRVFDRFEQPPVGVLALPTKTNAVAAALARVDDQLGELLVGALPHRHEDPRAQVVRRVDEDPAVLTVVADEQVTPTRQIPPELALLDPQLDLLFAERPLDPDADVRVPVGTPGFTARTESVIGAAFAGRG